MKKSILLMMAVIIGISIYAQSPVGKWKIVAVYTESGTGKKTDLLKDIVKDDPCYTKVIHNFTADGKMIPDVSACPKEKQAGNIIPRWKTAGKKITVSPDDSGEADETFELEIIGNKMRWIVRFPDDPSENNATEVRLSVIEYVKV